MLKKRIYDEATWWYKMYVEKKSNHQLIVGYAMIVVGALGLLYFIGLLWRGLNASLWLRPDSYQSDWNGLGLWPYLILRSTNFCLSGEVRSRPRGADPNRIIFSIESALWLISYRFVNCLKVRHFWVRSSEGITWIRPERWPMNAHLANDSHRDEKAITR